VLHHPSHALVVDDDVVVVVVDVVVDDVTLRLIYVPERSNSQMATHA